jgi:two-component system, chemotaxis family, sensor kinase Cph1
VSAYSPPFGQADLTNCERELIHLAGSVQPHGVLLVLDSPDGLVLQASANAGLLIGGAVHDLLGLALSARLPSLAQATRQAAPGAAVDRPAALQARLPEPGGSRLWEGALHPAPDGRWLLELEAVPATHAAATADLGGQRLLDVVGQAVQRLGNAASVGVLADATAQCFRDLIGHDRVMVYKFDADGHGTIIAEARDPRLESLLGHRYPASDIPQRARQLYLRNRVRVLVDVHYEPAALIDTEGRPVGDATDLSMSYLRSMSPLHLQYLKNMGVTATVVVSLVREGRLWGLVAAHHHSPRNLRYALRAACDLLAEVVSTRIAAIENYAHAQVAVLVRRLEQRLVEATSTEGDWRLALFRNPRMLLQPLEATGAALFVDGEVMTAGEVPSTPELRELQRWVDAQDGEPGAGPADGADDGPRAAKDDRPGGDLVFSCSSVVKVNPALDSITPTASGVLAVRLSRSQPDYLMWFRKEQLHNVTWAGDPAKPMVDNDPLKLSPRRSFAVWSELVRGTALPWTSADLALGRAIGVALVDIIVQVHAVRLLVAERQLAGIRNTVRHSDEPVFITDAQGELLFCNPAFTALTGRGGTDLPTLDRLALLFTEPRSAQEALASVQGGKPSWRGEMVLMRGTAESVPVAVRVEAVPARNGRPLGFVVTLFDQSHNSRAAAARRHLEQSMQQSMQLALHGQRLSPDDPTGTMADPLLGAIITNASLAAMDIADGTLGGPVAPLLEELELSTQRATALYALIRSFGGPDGAGQGG